MWFSRDLQPTLERLGAERPVLLLTGARQTGKTSLLEATFPNYGYVSLDLPLYAEQAEHDGPAFLAAHPSPLIVDEVQYAPGLLRVLKHAIDRDRSRALRYVLTGSQKLGLMQGVTESLAGRVSVLELGSLSLQEIERERGRIEGPAQLTDAIWHGGYPELHAREMDPRRFYGDYVATYLERDVRQALAVRSLRDFDRFLRLCATRTGQLLNMNGLAGDLGVSPNTIRSWLSVLEASNVVLLLPPFYRNLGKRLVKSPKLYFLDTGLACHLAGLRSTKELAHSALLGAFFETLVLGQIVRAFHHRGLPAPLFFFRDHHGNEVDFVVPAGERAHLIECKWTATGSVGRGMSAVSDALGEPDVLGRSCVTPNRTSTRTAGGLVLRDPVDFGWLIDEVP